MVFLTWIAENFRNGELFFYIIPIFLFILLLLTVFLPDNEKPDQKTENEKDKKESEKTESFMVEDLSNERVSVNDLITEKKEEKVPVAEYKEKEILLENKNYESSAGTKNDDSAAENFYNAETADTFKKYEKITDIEKAIDTAFDEFTDEDKITEKPKTVNVVLKGEVIDITPSGEEEAEALIKKPKSFKEGLSGTRGGFMSKLKNLFSASVVDDDLIEEMEEILYTADIGVPTVSHLMTQVEKNRKNFKSGEDVRNFLKMEIYNIVETCEIKLETKDLNPFVILMVGVNGAGKTTTIGKLTRKFKKTGKSVLLAAGDTFRAAAVEQLTEWGKRTDTEVIRDSEGADPASVTFNAVSAAKSRNIDIAIIDTAGRLQNRINLMNELEKVKRVTAKARENAPDEIILVVDANNGQNALSQAVEFNKAVGLTGIIITKLDGSAKGGVIIGIAKELKLPIYYIGIGESVEDLREFNAEEFVEALFI